MIFLAELVAASSVIIAKELPDSCNRLGVSDWPGIIAKAPRTLSPNLLNSFDCSSDILMVGQDKKNHAADMTG